MMQASCTYTHMCTSVPAYSQRKKKKYSDMQSTVEQLSSSAAEIKRLEAEAAHVRMQG